MERWKSMIAGEKALDKLRAKQMIELTAEGPIKEMIPELLRMVLKKIEVHDKEHFTVCFLDGTKQEILV